MTVIAWDGESLAADKQLTSGHVRLTGTKIYRVGRKLVGFAGGAAGGAALLQWVAGGMKTRQFPELAREGSSGTDLLVIDRGVVYLYESGPIPIVLEDQIAAIGSGRDFALAAMRSGLPAEEAVMIAGMFDITCGNGVDVLTLKKPNTSRAKR